MNANKNYRAIWKGLRVLVAVGPWLVLFLVVVGKIAFESHRLGIYEIYVMNADGTNPTRLTNNTDEDDQPRWSRN